MTLSCPFTHRIIIVALAMLMGACDSQSGRMPQDERLFASIPPSWSGISFRNDLSYTESFNPYTYRNFFNGGGVGVGDLNNDGWVDLYFCGNLEDNHLYLNRGNFQFDNITEYGGVACPGVWSSGVSMVDVNGDGWLDIYVCKSGAPEGDNRHNELFINDANPDEAGRVTFTEQAAEWGIDDLGLSSHAAFFDYDRDGDLDCYLLNNSIRSVGGYDLIKDLREIRDTLGGNKLYRHDGDHFTDVSEEAGIYGSVIGFGLGVTIGDVNRDGWADIYVSNDFFERDYLYLNQQDGTFKEDLTSRIRELSLSSMGADLGDLNNDGYPEIFVTDMLPEGDERMKTKTAFEDWNKYQLNLRQGYHHQFVRNVLQLNNGNGTFSEIGRMTDVNATDWSWGALLFDFQNDGHRDIFVANGIYKDLTDQDYIRYYASPYAIVKKLKEENAVIEDLIDAIPSEPISNYAFVNLPGTDMGPTSLIPVFDNQTSALGLDTPSFSNGSAYADFDNDGDLDLVVNNVNMESFLYRNQTERDYPDHHWIRFDLEGPPMNTAAIGAQIRIKAGGDVFFNELHPMKGFQSCVDPRPLLGVGPHTVVEEVRVTWPDGKVSVLSDIPADQALSLTYRDSKSMEPSGDLADARSGILFEELKPVIPFVHKENEYNDFDRDRLLFHMKSAEGPAIAWGDVDGNGFDDVLIGGARGQASAIFIQVSKGRFTQYAQLDDSDREAVDAVFFDADGDGKEDLYVCYGGNDFSANAIELLDRLYHNRERGNFVADEALFQHEGRFVNSGCVAAADMDADGDIDLFVGERIRNQIIGVPGDGLLLENDGRGNFSFVQQERAPAMKEHSLFTDATWHDMDEDGDPDLITVGEWSTVTVWKNDNGSLRPDSCGLDSLTGWWNTVEVADMDGDGLDDLILGNHGTNSRFQASAGRPVEMYVNDFDGNGSVEQIITVFEGDTAYPMVLRHDLVKQLPGLSRKYPNYHSFQRQSIEDMFSDRQIETSVHLQAQELRSGIAYQLEDGRFTWVPLPREAQISPIRALLAQDLNGDNLPELVTGGNFHFAKPEVGMYDASYGQVFANHGDRIFTFVRESGLFMDGMIRDLTWIDGPDGPCLMVFRHNSQPQVFSVHVRSQ